MYQWRNNKLKNQYDLQLIAAKNKGLHSFSQEDLSITTLQTKDFTDIKDVKIKRLIELAYIRGRLNGIRTADEQLEQISIGQQLKNQIQSKQQPQTASSESTTELLYVFACKIKNANDKITYVAYAIKGHGEPEAKVTLNSKCAEKKQTILKSVIVKIFSADTMQFQFGVGTKELTTLIELGKKMMKS